MKKINVIAVVIIMLAFTGCNLALEPRDNSVKLIGIAVTREYVDLFNFDEYMADNAGDFVDGGNIFIDDTAQYEGRLYAEVEKKELTDEQGEPYIFEEYVFPQYDVVELMVYEGYSEHGSYIASQQGDGMELTLSSHSDEVTEISGIMYVSPKLAGEVFYFNPIFQTDSGEIFLTTGSGFTHSSDFEPDNGVVYTHNITDEKTITEDGESRVEAIDITIEIHVYRDIQGYTVTEYGKDEIIEQEDYKKLPENFEPNKNTEYIVLERWSEQGVEREIYEPSDNFVEYKTATDDGLFITNYLEIQWSNGRD